MFNASELRKVFWPIESEEYKKFFPMAMMMFFILLNYSTLRSIKDGFVVTQIGPEAIGFLKTYVVLPSAIIAMVIYAKLCNIMNAQKVFYTVTGFFIAYLAIFTFILYPDPEYYHLSPETAERLIGYYPRFKWFIKIIEKWSYATLYTISELWGSMMLSLLFWQFANQITKTHEAKRFYPLFGLISNLSLPLAGYAIGYFLSEDATLKFGLEFTPLFTMCTLSGIIIMGIYAWVNNYVLTDPRYYDPTETKAKKSKAKLSLVDSFKLILTSRYLGYIALLVLSYGVAIIIAEGIWKSKIKELYPLARDYTMFMGKFQIWQGWTTILFMIIGNNILRIFSWRTAAIMTPLMILVTGLLFFAFIFYGDYIIGNAPVSALYIAVLIGATQNILSKATKYSLFDSTKEMAYIPLDTELQTKGKAAVDVVGGRLGKSGGGFIQSSYFLLFPALTFADAVPHFAIIFLIVVVAWLFAVNGLSKQYYELVKEEK